MNSDGLKNVLLWSSPIRDHEFEQFCRRRRRRRLRSQMNIIIRPATMLTTIHYDLIRQTAR